MSGIRRVIGGLLLPLGLVLNSDGAMAQELSALARVGQAASQVQDAGRGVELRLDLSQPVPYRLRHVADPPRFVLDFNEVDWAGVDLSALDTSDRVTGLRAGVLRPGWSRLVIDLAGPFALQEAVMQRQPDTGRARLEVRLMPVSAQEFADRAAQATPTTSTPPDAAPTTPPATRQDGSRPLRVVLDPGHGGIDPGAERGGVIEADLMLSFARELQEVLLRAGFEVVLTRDGDFFVPLETRISIARRAQADVFLSLHADVVAEGDAVGATVYTLSETASGTAAKKLAERHDRADLLAGVDLTRYDDVIAGVLMDMARVETAPRSHMLADELVMGLQSAVGRMHKRPHQRAGFSVLKAPDIPSVLIELGFMSSKKDLENLLQAEWRQKAAQGIGAALQAWAKADAAQAQLIRQ